MRLDQIRSDILEPEFILLKAGSGLFGLGQAGSDLQEAGSNLHEVVSGSLVKIEAF